MGLALACRKRSFAEAQALDGRNYMFGVELVLEERNRLNAEGLGLGGNYMFAAGLVPGRNSLSAEIPDLVGRNYMFAEGQVLEEERNHLSAAGLALPG